MTATFGHGLVVGKFYPPHRGHQHLIQQAAGVCARVTVLVMAAGSETLPLEDRVAWLRASCADLPAVTVTEAGRDYTITKWRQARAAAATAGRPDPPLVELEWTRADFDAVAAEQTHRENEAAAAGSPLLVCDTDAFATSVWERRYLGGRARSLQPWATEDLPRHDVYLLTSHEGVPWHDDGLREGDLEVRAAMTGWFAQALTAAGHSWVLLTGSVAERLALAVRVTAAVLAHRAAFGLAITDAALASGGPVR